jgi:hypothetical protein
MTNRIFERSWVERIPAPQRWADPFVHQLAHADERDALLLSVREQLERTWAEIPADRRHSMLLGLLRSEQDPQHFRARDVLFAGTALSRLGWDVHWEPKAVDGLTPDFKLSKNGIDVFAEAVTPEVDSPLPSSKDTLRFRDAIDNLESEYGIWIDELEFGPRANAAAVGMHFAEAIERARSENSQNASGAYDAPHVRISYRLERRERRLRCPYFGTESIMFWGPIGVDQLRDAIVRKIRKYKRPMVLITGVPTGSTPDFDALDEAMYGSIMDEFQRASGAAHEKRGGGLMIEPGEDGDLIRQYLLGVLGIRVEMPMGATRHRVRLHLFHAQENQDELQALFEPLPQHTLRAAGAMMNLSVVGEREWSMIPGE